MAQTDTRDRVIALERDVIHLGELFEKMQLNYQESIAKNTLEHTEILEEVTNIKKSVNGDLKKNIRDAVKEYMPTKVDQGLAISDKVWVALISFAGSVVVAIISRWVGG